MCANQRQEERPKEANRFEDTRPLMPEVLRRLGELQPGHACVVPGADGGQNQSRKQKAEIGGILGFKLGGAADNLGAWNIRQDF
jgi:hypothetical protein